MIYSTLVSSVRCSVNNAQQKHLYFYWMLTAGLIDECEMIMTFLISSGNNDMISLARQIGIVGNYIICLIFSFGCLL